MSHPNPIDTKRSRSLPSDWQERKAENRHFDFRCLLITLLQLLVFDENLAYPRSTNVLHYWHRFCYFCRHLTESQFSSFTVWMKYQPFHTRQSSSAVFSRSYLCCPNRWAAGELFSQKWSSNRTFACKKTKSCYTIWSFCTSYHSHSSSIDRILWDMDILDKHIHKSIIHYKHTGREQRE